MFRPASAVKDARDMMQCRDCEFYRQAPDGSPRLLCDPFINIKEPECVGKWQLLQLSLISKSHQATLDMYKRLAPLQEKMFLHMEREIDEAEDTDRWKYEQTDDEDDPFRL